MDASANNVTEEQQRSNTTEESISSDVVESTIPAERSQGSENSSTPTTETVVNMSTPLTEIPMNRYATNSARVNKSNSPTRRGSLGSLNTSTQVKEIPVNRYAANTTGVRKNNSPAKRRSLGSLNILMSSKENLMDQYATNAAEMDEMLLTEMTTNLYATNSTTMIKGNSPARRRSLGSLNTSTQVKEIPVNRYAANAAATNEMPLTEMQINQFATNTERVNKNNSPARRSSLGPLNSPTRVKEIPVNRYAANTTEMRKNNSLSKRRSLGSLNILIPPKEELKDRYATNAAKLDDNKLPTRRSLNLDLSKTTRNSEIDKPEKMESLLPDDSRQENRLDSQESPLHSYKSFGTQGGSCEVVTGVDISPTTTVTYTSSILHCVGSICVDTTGCEVAETSPESIVDFRHCCWSCNRTLTRRQCVLNAYFNRNEVSGVQRLYNLENLLKKSDSSQSQTEPLEEAVLPETYTCYLCKAYYDSEHKYVSHVESEHGRNIVTVCEVCKEYVYNTDINSIKDKSQGD